MNSIGLFHMKGGVAKSAITVFLADFLSSLHEQRVLVVDLDPQGTSAKAIIPEPEIASGFKAGKSLTRILRQAAQRTVSKAAVQKSLFRRKSTGKPKRGSTPIGAVDVLATERNDWRDFSEKVNTLPKEKRWAYVDILKDSLAHVADDYDIALIDFPGSEIPFWTYMGLRATDRWLLPEIPDYFSVGDIDSVVEQVEDAQKNTTHVIRPLGTLLTICPNRSSTVYRKTRAALTHLEKLKAIPPLFSKEAEVLHRPDAQKATDWQSEESKSLVARYGPSTSPFHVGLRKLANEVMERLGKSSDKDKLSVVADLRRKLTDYWRG
jgi:chromosome partitioning protein